MGLKRKGRAATVIVRGTAAEKREDESGEGEQGLHLPFVVVIIIIAVARMATSSLQLASRVCVSLK